MRPGTLLIASAVVVALGVPFAGAQAQMRQGTGPGMMNRDGCEPGMGMMCMMGDQPRMGMMGARDMTQRVEQRLTALKAQLKITEAQTKAWDEYTTAVRGAAKAMADQRQAMMDKMRTGSLPQRLDMHEAMLVSHLEQLRKVKEAAGALYSALSVEQKKVADAAMMGPMMRRGMRGAPRSQ